MRTAILGSVVTLCIVGQAVAQDHDVPIEVDNRSLGEPGNKLPARVMIDFAKLLGDPQAQVNPQTLALRALDRDGRALPERAPVRFDDPAPESFHHVHLSSNARKGFLVFQHQVTATPVARYILQFERWTDPSRPPPASPAPQIGDYDLLRYPETGPMSGNFQTKLTVCDWDNDGLLDIVAGDTLGKITFYRRAGEGDYDFDTPQLLRTSDGDPLKFSWLTAPDAADFDGDGDLDLIVGDETSGVFLVENAGSRSEPRLLPPQPIRDAAGQPIKSPKSPVAEMSFLKKDYAPAPTIFDYNGDGKQDLVFGGYITGLLFYYENVASTAQEKPRLEARSAIASADGKTIDVTWSAAPAFGDLDADGLPDMAVGHIAEQKDRFGWTAEPSLYFWKNAGTRSEPKWTVVDFGFPRHWDDYPPDVTVPRIVDWNGDGKLDILMSGRSEIFHFENVGSKQAPRFEFRRRLTMRNGPLILCPRFNAIAPVFADLDGDGLPDLISGGSGDIPWSRMLEFGNAPTFEPRGYLHAGAKKIYHEFSHGDDTTFPFAFDWDADGLLDLLVGDGDGYVTFYRNEGSRMQHRFGEGTKLQLTDGSPLCVGEPTPQTVSDFEGHSGNRSVPAPGDYDGDGKPDLICANAAGNVFFYRNDGNGRFFPGIKFATGNNRGWTYPIDWDADGNLDVVLNWSGGEHAIYLNRGGGEGGLPEFEVLRIENMPWIPIPRPIAMDWDRDGDIDLLWASSYSHLHFSSRDFIQRGYVEARLVP